MKSSLGAKTVSYPLPVYIVGTYDKDGMPNIMAASWGGICNSVPPAIAVSVRKSRHTYKNLMESEAFTVNIPSDELVKEADYSGTFSGKDVDKFKELGLTAIRSEKANAPYIEEFPVSLICKVIQTVEIGSHVQFIGEILDVLADDSVCDENGVPQMELIKPLVYDYATRSYYMVKDKTSKAYISR
jgi:flavin reductase (DIM6/NTAB) family NADH-FMN oxidoreductase RutF